jgi:TRAP-type C4-dicarboxylate transport system permease small subunit
MPLMNSLTGAVRMLDRLQLGLAMLSLTVMMLTTVADVVLRFGFGRPIHGAYDVVETCLALFVFNGMAAVFFRRQHIVIDLIDHIVGPRGVRVLATIGECAGAAMLLVMLAAMIEPAVQAFEYGDRKLELGLPTGYIWAGVIAGGAGALACAIGALLIDRDGGKGDKA